MTIKLTTQTTFYTIRGMNEHHGKFLKFDHIWESSTPGVYYTHLNRIQFVDTVAEATAFDDFSICEAVIQFIHSEGFAIVYEQPHQKETYLVNELQRQWRESDICSLTVAQLRKLARFYGVSLGGIRLKRDLQERLIYELVK